MWSQWFPMLRNINQKRHAITLIFWKFYYEGFFRLHGFPFKKNWQINGTPFLRTYPGSRIEIGHRLVLTSNLVANPIGVIQPVFLRVEANAYLKIGNDVGISGSSISVAQEVTIGSEVLIGSGVLIMDNDMHQLDPINRRYSTENIANAPVHIGDKVFIGARSIVLKGVQIGNGSVIGAGSVVSSDIPSMCIAVGNPARVVKRLSDFKNDFCAS